MTTSIQEIDDKYVVTLAGEMDTAAANEAEEVLKQLYQNEGKEVVFECENLEYIASSGLRIRVVLRNVNDDIKNVFKLTGFLNIFEFE